jgi:hypothetical protein
MIRKEILKKKVNSTPSGMLSQYPWMVNRMCLRILKVKEHYIGTILQAQGLRPGMTYFFEGDDSTVIDGSLRLHGTGSEDYFNGGWYALMDRWDGPMSLPLHGALDYSLPFCRTGGYRFYLNDKLSFEKSLHHSMEHGPVGNKIHSGYTSIGFYYAATPPSSILMPEENLCKIFRSRHFNSISSIDGL